LAEAAKALEAVSGRPPLRVSAATGAGVPEALRRLMAAIREDRAAETEADGAEDAWTP
jgi:hypothetical protein